MEGQVQELSLQIKQLFQDNDLQTIKFILGGETTESLDKLCKYLPQAMGAQLKKMYEQLPREQEYEIQDQQQRNRRIDLLLQKEQNEQKNQSFLEMISKVNEKLIYEEYFGFPFYDLCKRILITNGDLHPVMASIKTIHSQVQILYSVLFSKEVMEWIVENCHSITNELRQFLSCIFPIECQKYFKFHRIYKNLKKQTAEQQLDEQQNDQQKKQISINEDQTLQMDQKQFLVNLSDYADQFQQFQKNRSYNFLCFGLRKYQNYIGLGPHIYSQIKERQFCQLLSFLSIRFIRRILFTIIRERNNGQLKVLKDCITSQDIKRIGNEVVDSICNKINQYIAPVRSIEEDAKAIFFEQFQPYSYRDFIPRKAVNEARALKQPLAQYVWRTCKEYKTIWNQRIKSQNYFRIGGIRPQFDYVNYIDKRKVDYQNRPAKVWKDFIMTKFGFEIQQKVVVTRKRMKLDSLND